MAQNLQLPPVTAHPKMIRLYEYWRKKAPGPGLLPSRRDIDPTDIPALLDNIWMLDVVGEPRRFRFRLIGDAMQRKGIPGRPGEFVDQFFSPGIADERMAALHAVASARQPSWARGRPQLAHRTQIDELERILLPLASDGRAVDVLLCLTVFYQSDGREF
jgi:hypothetical protein